MVCVFIDDQHSWDLSSCSLLTRTVGSYFVLAMLDKLWHPNLTEAEALELQVKGVEECKRRLVVAPPDFIIKVRSAAPESTRIVFTSDMLAIALC